MSTPVDEAARSGSTAPAVNAPTWSGRKTAVAAALAIGLTSAGAVAAAAALPAGSGVSQQGPGVRGGFGVLGGVGQQGPSGPGSTGRTP